MRSPAADVVIAVRGGATCKSRLASVLSPDQRSALVEAMLADMLDALRHVRSLAKVYVVTPTPALARIAQALHATVVSDRQRGLNAAFACARRRIAGETAARIVAMLPGDLPLLRSDDLDAAVDQAAQGQIAVAATQDGGTGALICPAAVDLYPAFGRRSFARHLIAAKAAGLPAHRLSSPGLCFDVDQPADLDVLSAAASDRRTTTLLRRWKECE